MGCHGGQEPGDQGDGDVDHDGPAGGDGHVEIGEEIKAGGEAADDGADDVAAVEKAQPGDAAGRGFDVACYGRGGWRP